MNRRTKIIVSVSGIFIVLLALLGLTYAYFLTKINGNTNPKSISVTTANLELTYGDGNGIITGTNIMPGTTLTSKTFSVTNNGEDTSYIVVLENATVKDSSNNAATFESNDFIYTLTCTSDCNGVENEVLPINNGILVSNDIKKGVTQNYTLKITYKETGVDQSNDMGKSLSARVNISTIEKFNPYASNTLAYNIINNSVKQKNGTEFRITPLTTPAKEKSLENERELSIAPDDYGISYYYRGSVLDNYLELNNMCFRIVRIEGDGSVKITLAKEDRCQTIDDTSDTKTAFINNAETVMYGYETDNSTYWKFDYEGYKYTGLYKKLNEWGISNLSSLRDVLKNETWCLGGKTSIYNSIGTLLDKIPNNTTHYYETAKRLNIDKIASYKCSSEADMVNNYIGALVADEVSYAGGNSSNNTYYLYDNAKNSYWTLSRGSINSNCDNAFGVTTSGGLSSTFYIGSPIAVRPALTLKSGVILANGDGTIGNPYKIDLS